MSLAKESGAIFKFNFDLFVLFSGRYFAAMADFYESTEDAVLLSVCPRRS
jgi:hypothetical protein